MSRTPAYDELAAIHARLHRYEHLAALAAWDRSAMMPPKGNEARAAALAEIGALMHRTATDPRIGELLQRAADEPLDDWQRADLRETRRQWTFDTALPTELIERKTLVQSRCEHAWRMQRPANDWAGFAANFRPVLDCVREEAQRLADATGLAPYDALLERYEPGLRAAELDRLFGEVRAWLPALVDRALAAQAARPAPLAPADAPRAAQRAASLEAMRLLGFDFDAGRLDESPHPFCGGMPEDVRMTTRYRDGDPLNALMSTIHETGHARYVQNLPAAHGRPVARPRSFGVHEGCSLSFEMQLARSRPFCELLAPLLRRHFGTGPAFEPDNLYALLARVERGRIRVDADEVTYPAHVILRYEIERPLIDGAIEIDDIPPLWDAKMAELLGLDTRGDFRDGPLQDVHWADGSLGYFPCYTLGAMMAAQWFEAVRAALPDLDAQIAAGELAPLFDWLREHVWSQGSRWETAELMTRATGRALDAGCLQRHLQRRYLESA